MNRVAAAWLFATILVAPCEAAAQQPELWATSSNWVSSIDSVLVIDSATGTDLTSFDAPAGIRIGSGVMTPDRRSFLAPVSGGIARIDVATRVVVELIPSPMAVNWIRVSPSGRWWHIVGLVAPPGARGYHRYQVIDAVTRQVVVEESDTQIRAVGFDGERQYRLASGAGFFSSVRLQAFADDATDAFLWLRDFSRTEDINSVKAVGDLAAAQGSVYLVLVSEGSTRTSELVRLDASTGAELARQTIVSTPIGSYNNPNFVEVFNGRVYVDRGPEMDDRTLAMYDAETLAFIAESAAHTADFARELLFDPVANVGYLVRTAYARAANVYTFDPVTLQMERTVFSRPLVDIQGFALGEVSAPSPVRVRDLAVDANRVTVQWEPSAAGPVATSFEIRGARRGDPLTTMTTVEATSRSWQSPSLPPGSYAFEIVARNRLGSSAPSSVETSLAEDQIPQAPTWRLPVWGSAETARFAWDPPALGPAPSRYRIEAAPQTSSAWVTIAETTLPEFATVNAPTGQWQVRARGITAGGVGPPSSASTLITGPCMYTPGPPNELATLSTGNLVTLQWDLATTGPLPPPKWYVIEVGSAFGLSDLARITLPGVRESVELVAPSGVYVARVRGLDRCGLSSPTSEVIVTVP